jgi:hypothetical protein
MTLLKIKMSGGIYPANFDKRFMALVHRLYAPRHFEELGRAFEKTFREVEVQWQLEMRSTRVAFEGRRGKGTPITPIERAFDLYSWEFGRSGDAWFFRFGANSPEQGKDLRRMEYVRNIEYKVLKSDAPVRRGRPPDDDYEVASKHKPLGIGPMRYAKHIHLETWEWQSGGEGTMGGKYEKTDMAPFKAMCAQIFIDTIEKMSHFAGRRT